MRARGTCVVRYWVLRPDVPGRFMVTMGSLYEKYGGFATVNKLVHVFYDEIKETESLAHYFKNSDMSKLIKHQTDFLCAVLGGPQNYSGRNMREAHSKLEITDEAFGEIARILTETLEEGGVEAEDVETILSVVGSLRDDIVIKAA